MKDKDLTSIKALSQSSRPYPSTPRLTSQSSCVGPKYFSSNILPDDDNMDDLLMTPLPDPHSPEPLQSPPDTPTPAPREIPAPPPPDDLLIMQEFRVTSSIENPVAGVAKNRIAESIHAPSNSADQTMTILASPTSMHIPTPEEEVILAHLALAVHPNPIGGFLSVHMSHSAQIFDHLDNKVEHPKFMIRVFDHTGKDVFESSGKLCAPRRPSRGRNSKDFPVGYLVHNVSEETKELILGQRIWSAVDVTYKALPFNCSQTPELLFCLSGFTTSDTNIIRKMVADVWALDENRGYINDIFFMSEICKEEMVYKATRDLIRLICVEHLDFKVTGGLSVPRFNIFAISPTNDAKAWTDLRGFLHLLDYPTDLDGCGATVALSPCPICHSLAHPRGLCPFPSIPKWNGPTMGFRTAINASCQPGRMRNRKPGRNT
ncbi:uncharacterized protein F5147DRAFT_654640 [Suillus discolor]|uniref:Uncharacterized protein n=1 Tax=Suillus discolor TaxID=1912936 RepID=A0A9P7F377_9AGAM|nr:uncharacterized protein F5147DRAFT_654640 [Suillus discolor]KAG2103731.1 hypothetical protein F5147DRAFT_654640 [Suillus discolor]